MAVTARKQTVDNVRASRDGHEYHEAWTARKSMQLLWPDSDLVAIAVEGLSPKDQSRSSAQTVEIADITLYYDGEPSFESASRTSIVQFKYSVSREDKDFRASDAKKTIQKFGDAYREYKKKYGASAVQGDKLDFQIITNQPIYKPLLQAIDAIARNLPLSGNVKTQAAQFKAAADLDGKALVAFAGKCKVVGRSGSLPATKHELTSLLVDWSATTDTLARARLGQLKDIVRKKAGSASTNRNLITRTDILAVLEVADPEDLLPCRNALADVGAVVERAQLVEAVDLIPTLERPLLIHSAGGMGKTVFMDSLAATIQDRYEVVCFDCFGGGAYRSPEDVRHLPNKGLMHIANILAFRGLCDPVLPSSTDVSSLLRTFRRRLVQCVETISRTTPGRELAIFIDAIDNAELFAHQRSEDPFPTLLLKSLHTEPVSGLKLIVSCRTERKPSTYAECRDLELRPFSRKETANFLQTRLENVSQTEINVAQARSGGNPRVLDYLLKSGRGLLDESEIDKKVELDVLIQDRITSALSTAIERGYEQRDIDAFLAGLAVLPPPVPLDEYANALALESSAIESFASDLRPLLERTNHGLMFRDEPTETLVRIKYASSIDTLRRVADSLLARQHESVYAARALPGLLHKLDDGTRLFDLAFDDRIPAPITSTVGKRNIRYARLKAAALHAAINQDYNRLVRLLLELSTIAVVDERGSTYIRDYPDLVVVAKDVDATRRLFEMRTGWPGTRHARLAIANTLSGEFEEATRHARMTDEWINHYFRSDQDERMPKPGPKSLDIAAVPFFLLSQRSCLDAARYLRGWQDWYAYEVCEYLFGYAYLTQSIGIQPQHTLRRFTDALEGIGPLTAALSFQELSKQTRRDLIAKLSKLCKRKTALNVPNTIYTYPIQDGLRKAATIALSLDLNAEALTISLRAPHRRPSIYSILHLFDLGEVFAFVFRTALVAAAKNATLHEKDVLPKEIVPICSRIKKDLKGKEFRDRVKKELLKHQRTVSRKKDRRKEEEPNGLSYEEIQNAERFIESGLAPLLALTSSLSTVLRTPTRGVDRAFIDLLHIWEDTSKPSYRAGEVDHFFRLLGLNVALFVFSVRNELKLSSIKSFLKITHALHINAERLVKIIAILAKRPPLQQLAGEQARKARSLIEAEDEVESRAALFGDLGRAMLPASTDEASAYFRSGLEQMDAIGSGDYEFTNELFRFASTIKGGEIKEQAFHTLTNILELNMGDEPEKFLWGMLGGALSKTAGLRGLAKLSRWDDRSKISFANTLLPYLTALVKDGKIESKDALALNRLASPVEYHECGTKEFAKAIGDKAGPNQAVITELIQQFEDNNPGIPIMSSTVEALASLAEEALGPSSETTAYLTAGHQSLAEVPDTFNEHRNYHGESDERIRRQRAETERKNRAKLARVAAATTPADYVSLTEAISAYNDLRRISDLRSGFFSELRAKVSFDNRLLYVNNIFRLENLDFYSKLAELEKCRGAWTGSSIALEQAYKDNAIFLIERHADNLISGGRLSDYMLREVSDLTGVPTIELGVELIKLFARRDNSIVGAVWLAFASIICPRTDEGGGQLALERLLASDAAELANKVTDGVWRDKLYPESDASAIAAGLVWRMLGSPRAADRWRAAHSVRCFARFGRWKIIDTLVHRLDEVSAGSFQAAELPFYFLHARLWLLIALARIALDYPQEIARYKGCLFRIATEKNHPHVLMRHFAARCLLSCIGAGDLTVDSDTENVLRHTDMSPYPRQNAKNGEHRDSYYGRPDSVPKPKFEFHLDYDFHKHDVGDLSRVFGRPCWEVADMISEVVHRLDPKIKSMSEPGGRESSHRYKSYEMNERYHTYGQQLGWHGLFLAAGHLLDNFRVNNDPWSEYDLWDSWLRRYLLTRNDGQWLSDGTDRTPLDTRVALLETRKKDHAITGDQEKLLRLVGLTSGTIKELVVDGYWHSADGIRVAISSALVPAGKAVRLARQLIREDPMRVWVPHYQESEEDFTPRDERKEYTPWIVNLSAESRLDEHDPYGVPFANSRSRLARDVSALCSLKREDAFGRTWRDKRDKPMLRAEAWGREGSDSERGPYPGRRLVCSASALRKVLKKYDKDLLLLIRLERYEQQFRKKVKWAHTVAVVRIDKALKIEYSKGRINYPYRSRY